MGVALLMLVAVIGFALMSRPFKAVALVGVLGFGLAMLEMRWNVRIVPRGLSDEVRSWFQGVGGIRLWLALYGGFLGLMGLGVVLGVVRKASSTPEAYVRRRKAMLLFLAQWGALFMLFRMGLTWLIDQGIGEEIGWMVVQRLSLPLMIVFALLVVSIKWWWRKRGKDGHGDQGRQQLPVDS